MPNSYHQSDGIFNLHRRTIMDSFPATLFLRQLHLDLNMWCFINFTLQNWLEKDVKMLKMMSRCQKWRQNHTSCTTVVIHPTPHVRRFLALVGFTEMPVGYARRSFLVYQVKVLYVRNLTQEVTEDMLKEEFGKHGTVERVKKIKDYGFIHFEEREGAIKAMEAMDHSVRWLIKAWWWKPHHQHSIPIYPLQRAFYPQNDAVYPQKCSGNDVKC